MPYLTVADLREAGIGEDQVDDARLQQLIAQATALIDSWCGWWFEPRERTLRLDGSGRTWLFLPVPAVRLEAVRVDGAPVELSRVVAYCDGDDRWDPRLYLASGWPKGRRNVELAGRWGFVEEDGSTPEPIRLACRLLALRLLKHPEEWRRTVQEAGEGASVTYERDSRYAGLTGDPDIDSLLAPYMRPPAGAVV